MYNVNKTKNNREDGTRQKEWWNVKHKQSRVDTSEYYSFNLDSEINAIFNIYVFHCIHEKIAK